MSAGASEEAQRGADLPEGLGKTAARGLDLDRILRTSDGLAPTPPLEFADGSFDLIWSLSSFATSDDRSAWLNEITRLLDDGGVFVASMPMPRKKGVKAGREWLTLGRGGAPAPPRQAAVPGEGISDFLEAVDARCLAEHDALREEFHRELVRKSYRIAELESGRTGPGSGGRFARLKRVARRILRRR